VERRLKTQGKIIIDGNGAAALGAMFGGCTVVTWYPITPSSSLIEHLRDYMQKYRMDPETGKATFAIVQTEDELSAIGMVVGAGWAGARAMTATSGPGTSLMSEFAGYAYFSEIPAVLWDVQRLGPSTGLPTRTSQGDFLSNYFLSHGDTRHIMLIPATAKECFQFAQEAFNLAERFQTLVICMSDLDLGMNNWISEEFEYPEFIPMDRGKVLSEKELAEAGNFSRYLDVQGDGIPFRTIPGNNHPLAPYFTRGSGHNTRAEYSERPEDYASLMERLARKVRSASLSVPVPMIDETHTAIGIIAYGSSHSAVIECRDQLRIEHGIETDYLRIRALPPAAEVSRFMESHERVYIVEQNRDGQMRAILSMEFPESKNNLRSVLHYTGIPMDARFITNSILKQENRAE
jgi:2-oxoglutarate ferredoxin oxidoreductase subunit alpha